MRSEPSIKPIIEHAHDPEVREMLINLGKLDGYRPFDQAEIERSESGWRQNQIKLAGEKLSYWQVHVPRRIFRSSSGLIKPVSLELSDGPTKTLIMVALKAMPHNEILPSDTLLLVLENHIGFGLFDEFAKPFDSYQLDLGLIFHPLFRYLYYLRINYRPQDKNILTPLSNYGDC